MRLILLLIGRPVACLMITTSASLLGIISLGLLPVGLLPDASSPGITIITRYPGVSADALERFLTIPLERTVSDLGGIEEMLSSTGDGESRIHLLFARNTPIDVRILEASERIAAVRQHFPREVEEPSVVRYDPSDRPVFVVTFASNSYDLKAIRSIVDQKIKLRYERIPGVSEVFVSGGYEREIHVTVAPDRLAALQIPASMVARNVADGNVLVSGGTKGTAEARASVFLDARLHTLDRFEQITLPSVQGKDRRRMETPLPAIARVSDAYRSRTSLARTDGAERVSIYVQKAGSANALSVTNECERITAALTEFPDLSVNISYNQGQQIKEALHQVVGQCLSGAAIAVAVLYAFLRRIGPTIVIAVAIPASVLTTFFLMFLTGLDLNVMSLSGLALGGGMLVDNAIVVTEAIESSRSGNAPLELLTVQRAVRAIAGEIVAATLATVVVFTPLAFADEQTRALYAGFALTVSWSLAVSMLFSLTALPALLIPASTLEPTAPTGAESSRPAKHRRLIPRLFAQHWIARHRVREEVVRSAHSLWHQLLCRVAESYAHTRTIGLLFLTGLVLLPVVFHVSPKETFSASGADTIEATVDLEAGMHLDRTADIVSRIEDRLRNHPAISGITSRIEASHAFLTLQLTPASSESADRAGIIRSLRSLTEEEPDAFVHYALAGEETSSREIELEFSGDDIAAMKRSARQAAALLQELDIVDQVILRFRDGREDLVVHPDRDRIARTQSSIEEIGSELRQMLQGNIVTKFLERQGEREIDVRLFSNTLHRPEDVMDVILSASGRPLRSQVSFTFEESETRIWRKNKRRCVSLLIKLNTGDVAGASERLDRALAGLPMPPETTRSFGNAHRKAIESERQMIEAILASILLLYLVLGAQFESFYQPLVVMTVVPVSFLFSLCALFVLRQPLNMSVYIGLIMLGGIAVNNAIIIMGELNAALPGLRSHPEPLAYLRAGLARIRPIVMTLTSTMAGMLPMALSTSDDSGLWRPLAVTTVIGVLFSIPAMACTIPFCVWWIDTRIILPHRARTQPAGEPYGT